MVADPAAGTWPAVSVIAAVRNEERDLEAAVRAVLDQDYPGELELVLAVGPSEDATHEIASDLARRDSRVVVIDNPTGGTAAGLNLAIAATRPDSPYIIRTDGHAELPTGYVRTAVEVLQRTGADNVGGMMMPEGRTPVQIAVARAMSRRVGLGGGTFHVGGAEGPAPTVYLGCFRRDALERVGGFDEYYTRAQDWELNLRLRETGGTVWFTPELRVPYRPRSSYRELARQFYRTGQWRREVIRNHPATVSVRYLAPPVAVLLAGGGVLSGVIGWVARVPALLAGLLLPAAYVLGVAVASVPTGADLPRGSRVRLPLVLVIMHMAWGAGFLRGVHHQRPGDDGPKATRRYFRSAT